MRVEALLASLALASCGGPPAASAGQALKLDFYSASADLEGPAELQYRVAGPDRGPRHLILYSPGWSGTAIDSPALLDALAEAGFMVVSLHYPQPHGSAQTALDFSTAAAAAASLSEAERRVQARSADLQRVIERLDGEGWSGLPTLSTGRIGVLGYSLGAAVAAELCTTEPRVAALFNLDGWHFGTAAAGVPCPILLMSDDSPLPTTADLGSTDPARRTPAQLSQRLLDSLEAHPRRAGGLHLTLVGSSHADFAQPALPSWWQTPPFGSRLPAGRREEVLATYARAWFEQQLLGRPSRLLRGPSEAFPEVRFRTLSAAPEAAVR